MLPEPDTLPDARRSPLVWRLAAPSLAVSVVLLAVAGLAAVTLFISQRDAENALARMVQADSDAEQVDGFLKTLRLQLIERAAAGRWTDMAQFTRLSDECLRILRNMQAVWPSSNAELYRRLVLLDRELRVLVLSRSPEQRQATAERIVNELLAPELLAIAERERRESRQALLAAHARARELTMWTGWTLLLLGVVGAVAGALAGFGIARSWRRRLVELRVPIQSAAGSLDAVVGPVQVRGGAEVEDLEESLNSLAARVTDVVQRLQAAERESLRNDQLAALGQLAAGLAHELRNPLTSIRTLVEAARTGGPQSELDARDLEVIDEELTRLDSTLQTFLDFARPPKLERRPVDLRDVVRRTVVLVNPRAERQSVQIDVSLPKDPLIVDADPEQLRQVLLNLLLNALDALRTDGRIEVIASANMLTQEAVIEVADNGPGIPEAIRETLFDPFVSSKSSGTGLGLTICRRIIENHGGAITAGNRPTGGAVFSLRLPAESLAQTPAHGPAQVAPIASP